MDPINILLVIFFFLSGACVGSFLNVCIVRLPQEKSIVHPPSHCPTCKKNILWYDNIPLISFLLLKGRCRHCQAKISWRYFFVEFLTAILFVTFFMHFGLQKILVPYLFIIACFIVIIFVDFEHRIIPDEVSLGGLAAGLIFSFFIPEMHGVTLGQNGFLMSDLKSLGLSLLGAFVGGGIIFIMAIIGDWIFKKESMGGGDIKLLAMIGAFLGWDMAILTFFIAPIFGAVFGIIEKIRTKESTIAYGPFLVLGAIICLFWGDIIKLWLLNGYTLP